MSLKGLFSLSAIAAGARAVTFTVESSGGNASSPYQYGIMYEDINNSGDGGVYAELVQNRAFQGSTIYPSSLAWWYSIGGAQLALKNLSDPLSTALPSSMEVTGGSAEEIGFWNEGQSQHYQAS
jgi:alpha-L-arabinofuranosidase